MPKVATKKKPPVKKAPAKKAATAAAPPKAPLPLPSAHPWTNDDADGYPEFRDRVRWAVQEATADPGEPISERHPYRATIEAHSKKTPLWGPRDQWACGVDSRAGAVILKVTTRTGVVALYEVAGWC